jgi:hypothetical protein
MQYGDLITRSFTIVWRHRYLWLLAVLGGADVGAGGNGAYDNLGGIGNLAGSGGTSPPAAQFLQERAVLVAALGAVVLLVAIALLVLSCITTGALVRASAEHDAERPFRHGMGWRAGAGTFWAILGIRLLGVLWALLVAAVVIAFVVLGVVSYLNGQAAALAAVISAGIVVLVALLVASVAVGIVLILAVRAAVLEERGPIAAVGRGVRLLRTRPERVLLVWLLQAGLGTGAGLGLAIVAIPVIVFVAIPVVVAAVAGGPVAAVLVGVPLGLAVTAAFVTVSGTIGAYLSTFWTLAFRRLELDPPPPRPVLPG